MIISSVLRGFFTAPDNTSYELGRGLWALFGVALVTYEGFACFWKGQPFSPVEFGAAAGGLLAAGGFGIAKKDGANGGGS